LFQRGYSRALNVALDVVSRTGVPEARQRGYQQVCGRNPPGTPSLLSPPPASHWHACHHSDGARVQVDIAASQISMDGHVRILLVCRDVTERLMLEHELLDVASREQAIWPTICTMG
jgi:hypothetical protein